MNRHIDRHRGARTYSTQAVNHSQRNESVLDTVFGLAVMALVCAAGITMKVLILG